MLVAVSGSQSSGKSSTLTALQEHGCNVVSRKTSRSILADWGVTLQQVNSDTSLTTQFQDEISTRKWNDELVAAESDEMWFTERTHTDLFTYALVTLGKDNTYNAWLEEYYRKCKQYNKIYAHVYYLQAGHFDVVSDGTRGAGKHYSRMVDLVMQDFTKNMLDKETLTIVTSPNLDDRVKSMINTTTRYSVPIVSN